MYFRPASIPGQHTLDFTETPIHTTTQKHHNNPRHSLNNPYETYVIRLV